MVKLILTFISIYVMGFFTAMPIGATQIEIAKRSLSGHVRSALMVVFGSALSDIMYGFVAFFGIAPFLNNKTIISIFWLIGSVVLFVLGFITVKNRKKTITVNAQDIILQNKGLSFITGFSLAVTNPMMIFWWLAVAEIVVDIGLIQYFTVTTHLLFLLFGGLGIASYLVTLSFLLRWAKKFVSEKIERRINLSLGIILLLLGFYFFVRSTNILFVRFY